MTLRRVTYTVAGQRRKSQRWYACFIDFRETERRLPLLPDRRTSEVLARTVERVNALRYGNEAPPPDLARALEALPSHVLDKLVEWDILPRSRQAAAQPLTGHLTDWRAALLAKGTTQRHADLVVGRVRKILDGCGFTFYGQINGGRVAEYLAGLREDRTDTGGETETVTRGISAQTHNFYVTAIGSFCRWMIRERRATDNPVGHLPTLNVKLDRRRDRRALTVDELRRLLTTTTAGPARYGMTGAERAMMYRVAVETGLRANEIRTLTRASFDLSGRTVTVAAAYSKHRRQDVLPIRLSLADALRDFLAGLVPAAQVFRLPERRHHAAAMFRQDIEAADIEPVDDDGRVVDFHALRHTFISSLATGGVHPKVAQALARHSTITLTMDRYTHLVASEQTGALAALPDLTIPPQSDRLRAVGTDHALPTDAGPARNLATSLPVACASKARTMKPSGVSAKNTTGARCAKTPGKQGTNAVSTGASERRGGDSNSRGDCSPSGFQDRRLEPLGHLSQPPECTTPPPPRQPVANARPPVPHNKRQPLAGGVFRPRSRRATLMPFVKWFADDRLKTGPTEGLH